MTGSIEMTSVPTSDPAVKEADREPWRYVCPDCGSTRIRERSLSTGPMPKELDRSMLTPHVTRDEAAQYYCDHCQTPQPRRLDLKEDTTS